MSVAFGGTYAPGTTIRFRVVDPILGSGSSWSLATKGDTNDVYVTHRESGAIVHCSFHHSGVSQYTFTDAALRDGAGDFSRHLLETSQRHLVAPELYHAYQIILPLSELSNTYVERVRPRSFIEVPIHHDFEAVYLNLYLADGPFPQMRMERTLLVAEMQLGGGGSALLVANPVHLEEDIHNTFKGLIRQASESLKAKGIRNQEARIAMTVTDNDQPGIKVEIEVKLDLE